MPMSRWCTGTWVRSRPPMTTRPSSGASKPAIILSVVVLPQPDGPSSEKNSPGSTASSTPSTATTPPGKRLVTRSRRIEAGDAVGRGGGIVLLTRAAGEGDHAQHGGGGDHKRGGSVSCTIPPPRPLSGSDERAPGLAPSTAFGGPPPPLRGGGSSTPQNPRHPRVDLV